MQSFARYHFSNGLLDSSSCPGATWIVRHEPEVCQFERKSYLFPCVAWGQNIPGILALPVHFTCQHVETGKTLRKWPVSLTFPASEYKSSLEIQFHWLHMWFATTTVQHL